MVPNISTHKNRMRRLVVLQALYNNRLEKIGVGIILKLIESNTDIEPDADNIALALDYLEQRGFCTVERPRKSLWIAKITVKGIEYIEGDDPGFSGISHPSEFMS